jgi:hypothetical protein
MEVTAMPKIEKLRAAAECAVRRADGTHLDGVYNRELLANVEKALAENPFASTKGLARQLKVHERTLRRYRIFIERQAASKVVEQHTGHNSVGRALLRTTEQFISDVRDLRVTLANAIRPLLTRGENGSGEVSRNVIETVSRGYSVLERLMRFEHELVRELVPPTQKEKGGMVEQVRALVESRREYPPEFLEAWAKAKVKYGRPVPQELDAEPEAPPDKDDEDGEPN